MPNLIDGFIRAFIGTIIGLVISLVTKEIVSDLLKNETLGILTSVIIFAISFYVILSKMEYWGIMYTIGWIIGLAIIYYAMSSMVEWYEIILYLVTSAIILYGKISK